MYVSGTFEHHLHHTVKWLANKYYGRVWIIRGDLEYLAQRLKLSAHNALNPCSLCQADKVDSNRPWTHFNIDSAAMQSIYTNAEWYAKLTDRMCLFWVPGVGIASVIPYTMHCKHLGTDVYSQPPRFYWYVSLSIQLI